VCLTEIVDHSAYRTNLSCKLARHIRHAILQRPGVISQSSHSTRRTCFNKFSRLEVETLIADYMQSIDNSR